MSAAAAGTPMSADETLQYEARTKMRQAIVAGVAGILLVGAAAIQLSGPQSKVNELTLGLITEHKRFPIDVIGAAINGIALCAVAWTLSFLFGITRARNPDLRPVVRGIAIAGGVLAGLAGIAYAVLVAVKAHQFVTTGDQTYMEAHDLTNSTAFVAVPLLGQLGALLLAVGFVLTALNAMRVGLLTRFMGYLGIFTGILVLFPIGSPVPVVQGFWLLALAYLLSGRWPSGLPPAWSSGRAERWPSAQSLREQRMTARGMDSGPGRATPERGTNPANGKPADGKPADRETVVSPTRTRASTPKRKRKRRH
jgi:hypothetical protein